MYNLVPLRMLVNISQPYMIHIRQIYKVMVLMNVQHNTFSADISPAIFAQKFSFFVFMSSTFFELPRSFLGVVISRLGFRNLLVHPCKQGGEFCHSLVFIHGLGLGSL